MADQLSRRQFLQWSTAVVAGSALAACAPAAMPVGQGGGEESSQTNLTLLYWEDFEGPMQAEGYMEMHPEVAFELIPSGGEDTKLDAMIAAGTPPDLFTVGDGNFLYLLQGGVLLNLQPQVDADQEFDPDAFFPEVLGLAKAPNGDQYGLGPDFGAQLLYFNRSLFEEAGLEVPNEEWTWPDVQEAAAALTAGEGPTKQYGTMPHDAWYVQFPLIWQNGGLIFNEDGTECIIDSPEAIEALEYMVSYVHNEWTPTPQQLTGMGMESGQLFSAGRVAMIPGGHWIFYNFANTEEFEWDVTVVPGMVQDSTYFHHAFWAVSADTEHPEIAWDWIKFTNSPEWSVKYCMETAGQSSRIAVAEELINNPPVEAGAGVPKVWRALYGSARAGRNMAHVADTPEIVDSVWGPTIDFLWSGDLTAEQAAQQITEGANAILRREQ